MAIPVLQLVDFMTSYRYNSNNEHDWKRKKHHYRLHGEGVSFQMGSYSVEKDWLGNKKIKRYYKTIETWDYISS